MSQQMLTTVDNPFDPFSQFDEWRVCDERLGHGTLALLARVVVTSDELSEADQELAYDDAVNEIVRLNVSGVHRKVSPKTS